MRHFALIFLIFIPIFVKGQEIAKEFKQELFHDNFSGSRDVWPQTFNLDNLFILQNNTFELVRKNKQTGYFLIPQLEVTPSSYQVHTGFTLIKQQDLKSSAGLMVMANDKESKGICIEINANRSYRIMKISPDKTEPLTKGRNGWVKNTFAITKEYNEIMVKTHQRVYDLYINQKYIQSFSDIELVKGKIGLFIGPHSRASFQFITWMGEQKIDTDKEIDLDPNASPEEQTLTKVLIQMRNELKWKDKELEELKIQLKNCKASASSESPSPKITESAQKNQEKEQLLQNLTEENDMLKTELAKSRADLKRLQRMKSQMENMDDGDYVIQLTELVATQKSKIEQIENALIIADDNHRRASQELNVIMDEINKRNSKIIQLEQRNNTLDSLTNRYRDLLIKNNIDPNTLGSSDNQPKRDAPPPVKKNDQSTDTDDIIEEIIRRQREERRRREN